MSDTLATNVRVARRFTRAVRVDYDLNDAAALDGYVCSRSAVETLLQMARHLSGTGHGAFTWTGPYGSGKSSLAVMLGVILTGSSSRWAKLLNDVPSDEIGELKQAFSRSKAPWLAIPVVGSRTAVEPAIRRAISATLEGHPELAAKKNEALSAWIGRIISAKSFQGVALIIDEMGKFLEDAARTSGDIHIFQDLAELSARSNGKFLLVNILHQAFDEYSHRLAREARDEWIKVQGRYVDLPINLANDEQLELIGRAIDSDSKPAAEEIDLVVAGVLRSHRPSDREAMATRLARCWPLHPIVAALLGPISRRRFGQNQRSLFGFLNSAEPFGFQAFLSDTSVGEGRFPVHRLWDYLHANLEPAILASPDGHRWSTALEALSRAEVRGASEQHIALLKTIALIDLFKDRSGLQATPELLRGIAAEKRGANADRILDDLSEWSVIVFRKHVGSYAIYAGSDFDIEAAIDAARQQGTGVDYGKLARFATLQPVLAKRHYEETGALRWFEVQIAPVRDLEDRVRQYRPAPGAVGLFLLVISGDSEGAKEAQRALTRAAATVGDHVVVLGWARHSYMIREMAGDLAALEHVRATRPELEGDAIARREVDARLARLSADLEDRLAGAMNDVDWQLPAGAEHLLEGRGRGPAALPMLASKLASWRYPKAPRLLNELVNRTRPSSNAAAATRILLRAMVEHPNTARLNIEGYPPEAGLYLSLMQATGLHRQADRTWQFVAPERGDEARLCELWQETDSFLARQEGPVAISQFYELWRRAPFGVRDGLLPVLTIAYLMTRAGRCAVYLDNAFRPGVDSFLVDRMLQDPSCVAIRSVNLSDVDQELISSLARGLSSEDLPIEPTALAVARALVGKVRTLPIWVLRTTSLPSTVTRLRDLLKTADDPNRLLVDELPAAVSGELKTHSGAQIAERILEALNILQQAYPAMLAELEGRLLRELRVRGKGEASLEMLRRRAATVRSLTGNFRLDALATRLSNYTASLEELEGLASLAANKPARDWIDRDVDAARVELAALAQQFLKAEGFARLKDRPDERVAIAVYISDPNFAEPFPLEVELSREEQMEAEALTDRLSAMVDDEGVTQDIVVAAIAKLSLRMISITPEKQRKVSA